MSVGILKLDKMSLGILELGKVNWGICTSVRRSELGYT